MNIYETYKPSCVDWIGDIPESWKRKRIKSVSDNLDGMRVPINSEDRFDISGNIPYYGATGIVDYINDFMFDEELVLIGEDGAPFFELYKDVSFVIDGKSWVNNHAHVLRCYKNRVVSKFLMHWLNVVDYAEHIKGSTRDKLNQKDLSGIEIYLPILSDQLSIANYLDNQTQKIDKLIANKKAQAEKLKELRQIEINNAVTKGLNPNAEMKNSGIEWLGKIPKHWEVKRVKSIGSIVNGSTPSSSVDSYWDGDIIWVTPGDFKNFNYRIYNSENKITEDGYKNCGTSLVPIGSLILTTRAPIGNVLIAAKELCTNQGCKSIVPINVCSEFLYYYFSISSIQLNVLGQGTTFLELSTGNLSTFKVPVPPKEEQIEIANYLQKRTSALDHLIKNIEAQIEKLQELRKIKIYEAITGKIKVNAYAKTTA